MPSCLTHLKYIYILWILDLYILFLLLLFNRLFIQIRVVASDGGVPPCMTTEIATVTVTRNLNRPLFDPKDYETITLETALIGETVSTVSAEDSDSRVSPNSHDN